MHKLLDDYLVKKYPKIFAERNKPMTETCMCWGFPGDGWQLLIHNLCAAIQHRIDNPPYRIKKCLWNSFVKWWHRLIWNPILYKLKFPFWFSLNYKMDKSKIPQVVAHQVKEKFGSMRFYYSGGDEEINAMVHFAELLSNFICEDCGRFHSDVGQTSDWIHTICPNCLSKEQKENKKLISAYNKSRDVDMLKILEKINKEKCDTM